MHLHFGLQEQALAEQLDIVERVGVFRLLFTHAEHERLHVVDVLLQFGPIALALLRCHIGEGASDVACNSLLHAKQVLLGRIEVLGERLHVSQ